MAKGKGEIKGWITRNGVHIPIYGNYSVRGGVEPKAKGSKFKRKKRPEEFDKDIRESAGKYWAAHSSAQGKKQGVKDLDKPFDTKEEARAFLAKENGEYEDAKFTSKAESGQEKTIEVNGKKINVRPGENNSQAIYRQAMEEQGKPVDKEFYNELVADSKQESSKATPESYAQSKGKSIRDIAQEVNNNDAARAQANQLMKDGRTYEEAAALAHSDMERGTLKEQKSSAPDFSKMSYSEAGKYVAANKAQYGLKDSDDAYMAAYEMKQGTWKGKMPGQESSKSEGRMMSKVQAQAEEADVHRQRTSAKKVPSPRSASEQESSKSSNSKNEFWGGDSNKVKAIMGDNKRTAEWKLSKAYDRSSLLEVAREAGISSRIAKSMDTADLREMLLAMWKKGR